MPHWKTLKSSEGQVRGKGGVKRATLKVEELMVLGVLVRTLQPKFNSLPHRELHDLVGLISFILRAKGGGCVYFCLSLILW